jgi:hypothetical protein
LADGAGATSRYCVPVFVDDGVGSLLRPKVPGKAPQPQEKSRAVSAGAARRRNRQVGRGQVHHLDGDLQVGVQDEAVDVSVGVTGIVNRGRFGFHAQPFRRSAGGADVR